MTQNLSSYWIFYTVANAGNISKAAKESEIFAKESSEKRKSFSPIFSENSNLPRESSQLKNAFFGFTRSTTEYSAESEEGLKLTTVPKPEEGKSIL